MARKMMVAAIGLIAVVGALAGIKALQIRTMLDQGRQATPPPETVTTAAVRTETWESTLTAIGTLEAVQGVTVAAELPGKVVQIAFEAGARVKAGDLLLRQDTTAEEAQLAGAEAALRLAEEDLERGKQLLDQGVFSRSQYDSALANARESAAQVENLRAAIEKKTIRAPFAGRLGLRLVNLGQSLSPGDPIVSLQDLDPIFVDFALPQQELAHVRPGLAVRVTSDALPGETIRATVTAINPGVDAATRSVQIQASAPNRDERLHPGMYVNVAVVRPGRQQVLVIPATAVLYAPYGNSVFLVDEKTGGQKVLRQEFVQLGEARGDFVAVAKGLREGNTLVSTGAFKLRNGQAVVVDNTLAPEFQLAPQPKED
ncbi:MAG: efflux RND transporter periplasmic adaptor subunit [Proteobacteria bacterium]|nr:efflux RND transporter periplasmic adaptor subunit [Pseudomonadota bacterium]